MSPLSAALPPFNPDSYKPDRLLTDRWRRKVVSPGFYYENPLFDARFLAIALNYRYHGNKGHYLKKIE